VETCQSHGAAAVHWGALNRTERTEIAEYVPVSLNHLQQNVFARMGKSGGKALDAELAALGVLPSENAKTLFFDTVRTVILPRLKELGLPLRA
jgi:hypothetical protein